jgi:hypothetical protein
MKRWTTDASAEADSRPGPLARAALRSRLCPWWLANLLLRWRL